MQIFLLIATVILIGLCGYQKYYIQKIEERLYNALKITCETLNLIKKNATIDDIINQK